MSQKIMDTKTNPDLPDIQDRFLRHDAWLIRWAFDVSVVNLFVIFFFFSVRWHVWLYNPVSARQYIINGLNIFCHVTHWTVVTCEWTCNPRCTLHNSCFFCISFSEFRIVFLQVTDNRLINITMWLLVH